MKRRIKGSTGMIIVVVIFIILIVGITAITDFNDHTYVITVTDKDRIIENDKDDGNKSKYIVFGDTEEGKSLVFENTDNILRLKVNSSNIQGSLKEGHTYEITVIGYRVPLFSWYENIIKIKEIE